MFSFLEALLADKSFIFDPDTICFRYDFGEGGDEYRLSFEPLVSGQFHLALYKRNAYDVPQLVWTEKIPVRPGYSLPTGPGEEQTARRKVIKEYLESMLHAVNKAEEEGQAT